MGPEVFTSEAVRTALGATYDRVSEVVLTADQISPVLSAGTKGNPRQVKRFQRADAEAGGGQGAQLRRRHRPGPPREADCWRSSSCPRPCSPTSRRRRRTRGTGSARNWPRLRLRGRGRPDGAFGCSGDPTDDRTGSVAADWKLRRTSSDGPRSSLPGRYLAEAFTCSSIKDRKNFVSGSAPLPGSAQARGKLAAGEMAAQSALPDVRS